MQANSRQKNYLALAHQAQRYDLALPELIGYCRQGRLDAVERNGEWFVAEAEIEKCRKIGETKDFAFKHPYLKTLVCLVLVLYLILFSHLLSSDKFGTYLAFGGKATIEAAIETIGRLPQVEMGAAPIMATVENKLSGFWLFWADFWVALRTNVTYFADRIVNAWHNFLNPDETPQSDDLIVTLDQDIITRLKAEIKAELEKEFRLGVSSEGPNTGLVILPSSGNSFTDQATVEELSRVFSDQVEVKFQADGKTGLITPLFKSGPGRDYLFVITPINQ